MKKFSKPSSSVNEALPRPAAAENRDGAITIASTTSGPAEQVERNVQETTLHSLRSSKSNTPVAGVSQQQRDAHATATPTTTAASASAAAAAVAVAAGRVSREERSRANGTSTSNNVANDTVRAEQQLRSQVSMLRTQRSRPDVSSANTPSRSGEIVPASDDANPISVHTNTSRTASDHSPVHSETVRQTLIQSIELAHSNHTYLVKSLLTHARLSAQSRDLLHADISSHSGSQIGGMAAIEDAGSPFRDIQPPTSNHYLTMMCTFLNTGDGRGASTQSIVYQEQIQSTTYRSDAPDVPRYRNILHLERNILALNEKRLNVWPSFEDDFDGPMNADREAQLEKLEKRARRELRKAYTHAQPEARDPVLARRVHARQYRLHIEEFLSKVGCTVQDVIHFMIKTNTLEVPTRARAKWKAIAAKIPSFGESDSRKFRIVCEVFERVCRYNIWHMLKITKQFHNLFIAKPLKDATLVLRTTACYSCQLHNCPFHGEYVEGSPRRKEGSSEEEDEPPLSASNKASLARFRASKTSGSGDEGTEDRESASGASSSGNDSEEDLKSMVSGISDFDDFASINQRVNINAASMAVENLQLNGDSQVLDLSEINRRSLPEDLSCLTTNGVGAQDDDDDDDIVQGCSQTCYQLVPYMSDTLKTWTASTEERFLHLVPIYHQAKSGPCIMATILRVPCNQVYFKIARLKAASQTSDAQKQTDISVGLKKPNGKRTLNDWLRSKTPLIHLRPSFRPCNHSGPCTEKSCSCVQQRIACEPSCFCSDDCQRRFRGCSCHQRGRPCFNSASCECFQLNRECNPDLCGSCGVRDVLNPLHQHNDAVTKNRCANCHIQRNKPRATFLGNSYVAGFGLFAGETISRHEYVGEYKGEIISRTEETRRGTMYHYKSSEFLFDLNPSHFIDATYAGNKMRFINHSSSPKFQNCYTKALLCGVDIRMGIFAKRDLNPGEELFFPYGPGYDKRTKFFREMDGARCLPQKAAVAVRTKKHKRQKNGSSGALRKSSVANVAAVGSLKGTSSASGSDLQRLFSEIDTNHDADSEALAPSSQRRARRKRQRSPPDGEGHGSGVQLVIAEEEEEEEEDEDDDIEENESNYDAESGTDEEEEASSEEDDESYPEHTMPSLPLRASLRDRGFLRGRLSSSGNANADVSESEEGHKKRSKGKVTRTSATMTVPAPATEERRSKHERSGVRKYKSDGSKSMPLSSSRTRLRIATDAAAAHSHTSSSPAATTPMTASTSGSGASASATGRAVADSASSHTAAATAFVAAIELDKHDTGAPRSRQHRRRGSRGGSGGSGGGAGSTASRAGTLSKKRKRST